MLTGIALISQRIGLNTAILHCYPLTHGRKQTLHYYLVACLYLVPN